MIAMTYDLAHAAGTDAANAQMKAQGREHWNRDDYDLAMQTLDRLYPDPLAAQWKAEHPDAT